MVRRVKAYLGNMKVITDEEQLRQMSLEVEPPAGGAPFGGASSHTGSSSGGGSESKATGANVLSAVHAVRKRHPSPTLSTTSTTSSTSATSEGRRGQVGPKFGNATLCPICRSIRPRVDSELITDKLNVASAISSQLMDSSGMTGAASPQSVRKMLALSEPSKTRPYQPPRPLLATGGTPSLASALPLPGPLQPLGSPSPSPGLHRRVQAPLANARTTHERSHSDTASLPVDLSAESSSVSSLTNLPLRKSHMSGRERTNQLVQTTGFRLPPFFLLDSHFWFLI